MSRRNLIIILLAVLLLFLIVWLVLGRSDEIRTVRPQRRDITEVIIASGSLQAIRQSEVGTAVGGVVDRVLVREGDQVSAGQTIITLDRDTVDRQIEQARLAVETAQRELERVRRPAQAEDLARARAEVAQARRVGQARVDQARERLARLEAGGRPEERRQAEAALSQARASRQQAETDLQRAEQLFARGAIAQAEVDRARTHLELARAAERSAEEQAALVRQPAAAEDIAAARAELRAAQATLEESVRIAEQNLRALQNIPRSEDVRVAQARVEEAQAALSQAETEAARRTISAPFDGLVIRRNVEPGQSISPGIALLTVADMRRTEVVVETDETNLPRLREGQPAILIAPSYPDRPFRGTLSEIGPEVDTARGVVILRVRPSALPQFARPDMTVDANIEVARFDDTLAIPVAAIEDEDGRSYVRIIEAGRSRRQEIVVLARGDEYAAVEGISSDAEVAVRAGDVRARGQNWIGGG